MRAGGKDGQEKQVTWKKWVGMKTYNDRTQRGRGPDRVGTATKTWGQGVPPARAGTRCAQEAQGKTQARGRGGGSGGAGRSALASAETAGTRPAHSGAGAEAWKETPGTSVATAACGGAKAVFGHVCRFSCAEASAAAAASERRRAGASFSVKGLVDVTKRR